MHPSEFLETAGDLSSGRREADWRSSISRSYYALFLALRELLLARVPRRLLSSGGGRKLGHDFVVRCLKNCPDPDVIEMGDMLAGLRIKRQDADYDLVVTIDRRSATVALADARRLEDEVDRVGAGRIASQVTRLLEVSPHGFRPEA